VPGRSGEVVLTTGALVRLGGDELDALVVQERAHVRGNHHRSLALAALLYGAFPAVRMFGQAHRQIGRLVDMCYNLIALPIAAGVFEPAFGLALRPEIAALPMSGSSLIVAVDALALKRLRLPSKRLRDGRLPPRCGTAGSPSELVPSVARRLTDDQDRKRRQHRQAAAGYG
jgi:hypothetical protein